MNRRRFLQSGAALVAASAVSPLTAVPDLGWIIGIDPGHTGSGATAMCVVRDGIIQSVNIVSSGSGWKTVPTITFSNGGRT